MKIVCLFCIVVFLACSIGVLAQGVYLEKGQNGFGGEVRAILSQDGFEGLGVVTGYSIAGILDLGADFGFTSGEFASKDTKDFRIAFHYAVNVLKQATGVPLSLQVTGSYGLINVSSDYIENEGAIRRATGYTIGMNLARSVRLTSFWHAHLNILADYQSFTYNTTAGGTIPASTEHIGNLFFGGGLGFLFVFPRGSTLAVRAELRADQDLELQIHPIIALAFPQK